MASQYGGPDCDDEDPRIPAPSETWYNGRDEDCLGDDDYDQDGDGHVPDAYVGLATAGAEGSGELPGGDCDDEDPSVHPGATDACYDGIDADCLGNDDYDCDGDGYASDAYGGDDCDDSDAAVNPAATEVRDDGIDQDCDGADLRCSDCDGDGYDAVEAGGTDCDDEDAAIHPNQDDACDQIDNDCDGVIDDGYSVPASYGTVQAAVDAAPDGATVCLAAGLYRENLYIIGELTLQGEGAEFTQLDGDGEGTTVEVRGGVLTLVGLSVQGAEGDDVHGIETDEAWLELYDVDIHDNQLDNPEGLAEGTVLAAYSSLVVMDNVRIYDNTSVGTAAHGAVLSFVYDTVAELDHVIIADNVSYTGVYQEGLVMVYEASVSMTNVVLAGNRTGATCSHR